jgi:hypothetical protein
LHASSSRIVDVHAHAVLMLAATALVGLFVVIVVAVTFLQRRGRLGEPGRTVPFASYGPVIAAACSGGAAAVHLFVVGEHASLTVAEGSPNAIAFLCSVGAGTTHFSGADPSLAGFLPLGVLSIGAIGAQGALAVPRVWRHRRLLLLGLAVTALALTVAVATRIVAALSATTVGGAQPVAYTDALAIVFDVALLVVIGLLVFERPRSLVARLRISVIDAWVGTGLGVGAVAVFTVAGFLLAHATH